MKNKVRNNNNKIRKVLAKEQSSNITKYLKKINHTRLCSIYLNKPYQHYRKHVTKTVITTTCNLTARTKGPVIQYNLSRLSFRELIQKGIITGIHKYSW